MHGFADHPAAGSRNGTSKLRGASCPGVDRISWIRVSLVDGQPAAFDVHGTRHRRPVTVSVPYTTARDLIDAGVPAVIQAREGVVA